SGRHIHRSYRVPGLLSPVLRGGPQPTAERLEPPMVRDVRGPSPHLPYSFVHNGLSCLGPLPSFLLQPPWSSVTVCTPARCYCQLTTWTPGRQVQDFASLALRNTWSRERPHNPALNTACNFLYTGDANSAVENEVPHERTRRPASPKPPSRSHHQ